MSNLRSTRSRGLSVTFAALFVLSIVAMPAAMAKRTTAVTLTTAQGKQDFELHNETGAEITEVYLSETGKDTWEEDVLGQETLATAESVNIHFGSVKARIWDMKVVFSNGKEAVWFKFDLSQITDIEISFRNGKTYAVTKNGD
jgi:hypothetical protein